MKKVLIALIAGVFVWNAEAQEKCECLNNSYDVSGELTYTDKSGEDDQSYTEYYGIVKEGLVQFTKINYSKGKPSYIYIHTIPSKDINFSMNDMFSSYSQYEKKTNNEGEEYIKVEYGVGFNAKGTATQAKDECLVYNDYTINKGQKYINAAFETLEDFEAFSDKINEDAKK